MLQQYLDDNKSFGIETNLADIGSWKMILDIQSRGYAIQIFYFGIDDLDLSIRRIAERVLRGEHHVPANLVKERLLNSASLLNHYYKKPELIVFIDNTIYPQKIAILKKGKIIFKLKKIPVWVTENFSQIFTRKKKKATSQNVQSAASIEEVKLLYSKMKNKKA